MNSSVILQFAGSAVFAAVITALINALVNRRKIGAEADASRATATDTLTGAAEKIVARIESDNVRLREKNQELDARVEALEKREDYLMDLIYRQHRWIAETIERAGIAVPPLDLRPPPEIPEFQP